MRFPAAGFLLAVSLSAVLPAWAGDAPRFELPQYQSDWQNPHGNSFRVRVQGNYAFLTNDETSHLLEIVDVSDPHKPILVSHGPKETYPPHYMYITGLALCGDFAYVGYGGRVIGIDVSDKKRPKKVSEWDSRGRSSRCLLQADDHFLYVGVGGKGVFIVDVANPSAPRQVGFIAPPQRGKNVLMICNLAAIKQRKYLLAMTAASAYTIDVTAPTKPTIANTLPGMNAAYLTDKRLYSIEGKQRDTLFVRDMSNPERPILLNSEGHVLEAAGVDLIEESRNNIRHLIVAVAPTASPKPIQGKFQYSGRSLLILNVEHPERIADLGDPDQIAEVGTYGPRVLSESSWQQPSYQYAALVRSGAHTFAATYDYGLDVVDVSNFAHPKRAGGCPLSGEGRWISIQGNHLYYSNTVGGVLVLDASEPFAPRTVASVFPTGQLFERSHVVRADCLYAVGDGERRMDIIDVRQVASPQFMPPLLLTCFARGFRAASDGAPYLVCFGYVDSGSNERAGFSILDVSKPFEPVIKKTVAVGEKPDASIETILDGDVLYVATAAAGIYIFDVKDKSNPRQVSLLTGTAEKDLLNIGNLATATFGKNKYLYAASNQEQGFARKANRSGLFVFDVTDPARPVECQFIAASTWNKKAGIGTVMDLAVDKGVLYAADYWAGAFIFDLTDPQYPRLLNPERLPRSTYATGIAVGEHALYINRINGMSSYTLPGLKKPISP